MSVGNSIRTRREALGLTQEYVAEKAGITQSMLCQIERETKNPSLQISVAIADILKCSVDDFVSAAQV